MTAFIIMVLLRFSLLLMPSEESIWWILKLSIIFIPPTIALIYFVHLVKIDKISLKLIWLFEIALIMVYVFTDPHMELPIR